MRKRFLQLTGVAAVLVAVVVLLRMGTSPVLGQAQTPAPPGSRREGGPRAQDAVGRARPARHLDQHLRDPSAAALAIRRQRVLHPGGAGRTGQAAHRNPEPGQPAPRARQRTGRRRRVQHVDLPVSQADGPADVAHHRSARRPHSAAHAGSDRSKGRDPRVPARPAPGHRGLQEQAARLRGREVRTAVAAARRDAAVLPGDRRGGWRFHQPVRRAGGPDAGRALHGGRPARFRRRRRLLSRRSSSRRARCRSSTTPARARAGSASSRSPTARICRRTSGSGGATRAGAGRARRWWLTSPTSAPKTDFQGSRENLHLVERWTRRDANTLEYVVTIEDPTTWTKPVDREAGIHEAGRQGQPRSTRSRAATRGTTACRRCSPASAPRSAPSRSGRAPIRPLCAPPAAAALPAASPTRVKKSIRWPDRGASMADSTGSTIVVAVVGGRARRLHHVRPSRESRRRRRRPRPSPGRPTANRTSAASGRR